MKGLLLAGGHGTRLRPLTFTGNKHMIPIANQPMLFYGLHHLADVGIDEIGIILGPMHEGIQEAVGNGGSFGVRVTYITQGEPKGLAHAVLCAREFLKDDDFVMYLGDNLLQQGAQPLVRRFRQGPVDAVVGVTPVPHPSSYGVVELDGDRIASIEEKPANPRSNLALIGVYLFTASIHPIIEQLTPSRRGELEITDAIWRLFRSGKSVAVQPVEGWWKDTGKPEDLLEANEKVLRSLPVDHFALEGTVEPRAEIVGPVGLGPGSRVAAGSHVEGPTVIGAGVKIESGSRIGPGTAVGNRCTIRESSVTRSILLEGTEVQGRVDLVDSIVGRNAIIRSADPRRVQISCIMGDATKLRL